MKIIAKRLLLILHVLTLVFSLFACGADVQTESSEAVSEEIEVLTDVIYRFSDDTSMFKLFGRMPVIKECLVCDFTASGIEFEGKMTGKVVLSLSCDRDTYFTLYVDGVRQEERVYVTPETKEIELASFEGEDVHNIRILKQTEAQWSLCVLNELKITGKLSAAPENKEYFIEFIGDSITTGYGNLGDSTSVQPGTAIWQDGTRAYAFMTAEALSADCSIIGCSGIGIDKGWTKFSEKDFYPKASYYRDANGADHDFARVPDLVIINLGTNDQDCGSLMTEFVNGVKDLINTVRISYGKDMPIVWVYNMVNIGRFDWTRRALSELGGEDAGLYFVQLDQNREGGNTHPSVAGQELAAEKLVKFIKDKCILE